MILAVKKMLVSALLLGTTILQAQVSQNISGRVTDPSTGLPVEGVNIRIQDTYSGSTTDSKGAFELRVRELPAVLLVTHIAYFGKQILLTQSQSDSLNIVLNPKPINLKEAEIIGEKYKVFKGEHQEVIDYNFSDSNILILAYNFNKNRHELILTNEQFDTLCIKDVSYLNKPAQIFKDCLGSCHLFTKDSAFQIFISHKNLKLVYPTPFQTLKFLNDTIYYFNHLKSRIDIYTEDLNLLDTIHIDYDHRKNWKPVIITDKVTQKAYTIFTVGAKLMLSEINLKIETVTDVHLIDKMFPSKIRVHKG